MFAPLLTLLGGWLSKAWIYLAIAGAIIAAVTAVLLGARQAGRNAERVDNLRRSLDDIATANKIAAQTSSMSDAAVRDELRKQRDGYKG